MNQQVPELSIVESSELSRVYYLQKKAYLENPEPSYEERMADLKQLKRMLMKHSKEIKQAINADYGCRSNIESNLADVGAAGGIIGHISKHLKKWMKPQKRNPGLALIGAKARVIPQPLGIVGVIVPWNFPIYLSFPPVATAFAAGNRCLVKMSENSRNLAKLLKEISPQYFPENKLAFFDETGNVGIEFSSLPLDLLMFTGSPTTAKAVMASAAKNLTPVILELGGKNPVIIDPDYPLQKAVDGIMFAKQMNAGQVCLNVDYVFVHESQQDEFVNRLKETTQRIIPDINDKYFTSIIDHKSVDRLDAMLKDAEQKGAKVINLSEQPINREQKKFPFHAVLNPTPNMQLSQRETFGPITTIRTYKTSKEVIDYVNAGERPLGFYVFSNNKKLVNEYISKTMSGGVTVNGCGLHAMPDDLPFGGVGHSGMGHYHGYEGFMAFSKMRPVLYQGKFSLLNFVSLPYSDRVKKMLDK